ncbi:flavin-containing monooxygenase [Pseudarthrobacter sp. NPDC058329]|uniref:flavin-containing monooxygenase n=1 Tax=Pseudarthrobacter sp. NPDC058329 TaxID=3346448 RepID=UPI0036DB22BD
MSPTIQDRSILTFTREAVALDAEELRMRLQSADPAILLLCAVHITGDTSLLDTFAQQREVKNDGPARTELISIITEAFASGPVDTHLIVDRPDTFQRMAEIAVNQPVSDEFLPLLLEQSGFLPSQPVIPRTDKPKSKYKIAILGAGMAGIAAGILADRNGFDYEILERSEEIGGTWRINKYPGVAVDTPSLYYSYSFRLNAEWSKYYPVGTEYHEYLQRVVKEFDITRKIQFGTEVTALRWVDSAQAWEITSRDRAGRVSTRRASAVITAFGYLNRPKYADLPGANTFAGESIHSAHWQDIDFTGKKVAVIGSGATSVQLVPKVAEQAQSLTLFQRQPHWVMPPLEGTGYVPEEESWLLRNLPFYNEWTRLRTYWAASDNGYGVVRADPEWMAKHPLSISEANDAALKMCLAHIERSFHARPDLRAKMTPDYAPAGKRLVRDPGNFYDTLLKPHVDVVTEGLERFVPEGIVTRDGVSHGFDVIIHATGFTLDFLSTMTINGREGKSLNELWKNGTDPFSYLGGTVPGFPNLFVTAGPNTSPGHGGGHNFTVEAVLHYVFECLQLLSEKEACSLEPTEEAVNRHNSDIETLYQNSVWATQTGAHTYYRNAQGRIILPSPYRMIDFWSALRAPDEASFRIS